MRAFAVLLVLVGSIVSAIAQTRPSPTPTAEGTARIRGTLVDASTATPIRRASIRLQALSPARNTWTAITDASGAFEFPSLPSGRFTLQASKGGYVTLSAGQRTPTDAASRIEVAEGQTVALPAMSLPRGGVITGRIGDEHGDPAPEITVQAFRAEYMQGMRRLVSVRSARTNDIGQFRIYGLQPGIYYVAASALGTDGNPLQMTEPGTDTVRGGGGLAPTFYPGTVAAADAQRIEVAAAAESAGVDFALNPVRLARITGTIVDSRGRPAGTHAVMLNPARADGALLGGTTLAETDASGRFDLAGVAPGDYRLDVYARAFFERIAQTGSTGKARAAETWEFASVPITIAGDDVSGLTIKLTPGHSMSGRVVVEGATASPEILRAMRLSVMEPIIGTSATLLAAHASVGDDGTFDVPGLIGRRIVRVSGLPRGWTLKTVRARGVDITDSGVDITDRLEDVEVIVTAVATTVSGVVTDSAGQPSSGAWVVIFPEAREQRIGPLNRFVTSVRADGSGAFRVAALPAGRYFAVALPTLSDGEWAEPAHLGTLEARAIGFTLAEGESRTLGLRLASAHLNP